MSTRSVTDELTPKRQRFVEEYLIDLSAKAAATRAGYSAKTAGVIGYELLRKPAVQAAIEAKQKELAGKFDITQERVIEELGRIAFADIRKLVDNEGKLKKLTNLDDATAAAIASVEVVTRGNAEEGIEYVHKVRTWDKASALNTLLKLLTPQKPQQVEVTGKDGGPLQSDVRVTVYIPSNGRD